MKKIIIPIIATTTLLGTALGLNSYNKYKNELLVDRIINSYIAAFDELENNINKRCSEDFS